MAQNVDLKINAKDNASKHFRKAGGSAQRFGRTLAGVAGAVGAYLGARKLISFMKDSIRLFNTQDEAIRSLTDAMKILNAEAQVSEMQKFASQLQQMTIYGDEATLKLMQLGVSMGKFTGDTLKSATVASIGLADAFQIDVASAMKLVAKASAGDTGSLSRYGIVLDATMTKEEKFAELLRIGAENFEVSKGKVKTFGGMLKQLGNAWGDAKERLGSYMANSVKVQNAIRILQTVIENFNLSMEIVWTSVALGIVRFYNTVEHYFKGIAEQVVWLVANWKDVFKTVWNFTKTMFLNLYENAKNFFVALWSWIKGDGFDFKWTGLLEGFESTLSEMPKIARREAGAVEQALADELAEHKGNFQKALQQKMDGTDLDMTEMLKNAKATGILDDKTKKEKGKSGLGIVEGRLLSGISVSTDPQSESKKQTPLMKKMVRHLEMIARNEAELAKRVSIMKEVNEVTNFA